MGHLCSFSSGFRDPHCTLLSTGRGRLPQDTGILNYSLYSSCFQIFFSVTTAFMFKYPAKCKYLRLNFRRLGPKSSITIVRHSNAVKAGSVPLLTRREKKLFASISQGCSTMAWLRPPSETIKHLGNSSNPKKCQNYLPTKLCFLLSHSGAALTPFATKAKKAFFT